LTLRRLVLAVLLALPLLPVGVEGGAARAAAWEASGEVPVQGANLVGIQEAAVRRAMENAVDAAVRQAVADSVYQANVVLVAERVIPRAETFITHYVITGREVGDSSYLVRLAADLDLPLLRAQLAALGLLPAGGGGAGLTLEARGVPAPLLREAIARLEVALGEGTVLRARTFAPGFAAYDLSTSRPLPEALLALQAVAPALSAGMSAGGLEVAFPGSARALAAWGQTVLFYRRTPQAGSEANPDDVRGAETVAWAESEPNDVYALANPLPLEDGVLGTVDPAADRDLFLVQVPPRTRTISLVAAPTGPGEFRPRVRVFLAAGREAGRLAWEGKAAARGRSLKGVFTLPPFAASTTLLVAVEDDLGRFPGRFPYRLRVSALEAEDAR
jgi:hypothetical protein